MKRLIVIVVVLAPLAAAGGYYYFHPRTLQLEPRTITPVVEFEEDSAAVTLRDGELVAQVAEFDDELYAYFNFDYLKSRNAVRPAEVLLTHKQSEDGSRYPVYLRLENDVIGGLRFLDSLRRQGYIPGYEWKFVSKGQLRTYRQQSQVFTAAYGLPVQQRMERLTQAQKMDIVTRFVVFKSRTDPRVRKGIQPVPPTLEEEEARTLAADIITVTDFFWLPLDFFLGIGAMENNYMDVTGDLKHAVWKNRMDEGDIVLRRRNGRVLVLNSASGVWQITRETLRYTHRLYLEGDWDYSLLPAHLRPPGNLNLNEIDPAHLTTYAGLLFRDLIDRFGGDVGKAVGAYNGGPGNPNMRYERGVRMVANYARRMVEQAARLNGEAVAEMRFLAAARE